MIKLMSLSDEQQDLVTCGYICSELAINKMFFISDSLLAVVIEGNQVKVLSTELFRPGQVESLLQNK